MKKPNVFLGMIFIISIFPIILIIHLGLDVSSGYVWTSSWLCLIAILLSAYISKGSKITSTLFLYFVFLSPQLLALILPYATGYLPHYRFFSSLDVAEEYFIKYLLLLSLSVLILAISHKVGKKITLSHKLFSNSHVHGFVCLLPISLSLLVFVKIVHHAGSMQLLFLSLGARAQLFSDISGLISLLPIGYLTSCLYLINGKKFNALVTFIIISILMVMIGERGAVLFSGIYPLMIIYILKYRYIPKKLLFTGGVTFIIFFIAVGVIRSNQQSKFEGANIFQSAIDVVSKTEHQINAAATLKLADKDGYMFGGNFLNVLFAVIPRKIWPEKPVTAESAIVGMKLKNTSDPNGAGLPPGQTAYFYLNFGYAGVVSLFFLTGVFTGFVEKYFTSNITHFSMLFYSQTAPMYINLFSTEVQVKFIVVTFFVVILYFTNSIVMRSYRRRSYL